MGLKLRLLGPVEAWAGDRKIDLGPRKQRLVFAVLALEASLPVEVARLVDLIWPQDPPRTATHAVRVCVSALRSAFRDVPDVEIQLRGSGYALVTDPMNIDVHHFRSLLAQARGIGDDIACVALLDRALDLWSGTPLAGTVPLETQRRLCAGLEDTRLGALEDRLDAQLRLGLHHQLAGELAGLVAAHPLRERLAGQLMLALYRDGRSGDALDVFRRCREHLAEELGLDAGAALKQLELAILRNDDAALAPPPAAADRPVPAQSPAGIIVANAGTADAGQAAQMAGLAGRDAERARLAAVMCDGGALLLRGEPGAGKTALLEEAAAAAPGRVLRAAGTERMADIPYAAIAELVRPLRRELREHAAGGPLRAALGMEPATAGLSALAIEVALEDLLASSVPLLVVVDDVHWLDEVSARMISRLAGAARDLGISVLLAARPEGFSGYGVTEVAIQGLDPGTAAMLVRAADPDLAPGVVAELVEATAGNPLGLLELPRALTPAQRAGAEPVASAAGVTSRLVAAFGDRIRRLPAADRLAVITAAAADPADAQVLPAALELLGLPSGALDAAERDGLLRVGQEIRFRHPLVRLAALGDIPAAERRRVDHALAQVVTDAGRRVWHRAAAATGPDDELADELTQVAGQAEARIAFAAQSRLLDQAARLTSAPGPRARRLVDAAYAAWRGGQHGRAEELLRAAEATDPRPLTSTAGLLVRWRILKSRGDNDSLLDLIEGAVAAADQAPAQLAITAMRQAAVQRLMLADPDPAVRHAAATLRRAGNDPWLQFLGHEASAMACVQAGLMESAAGHCRAALALADAGYGHPDHVGTLGLSLSWCELYPQARRVFGDGIARHRRAGNPYFIATSLQDLGEMLRRTGDLAAAELAAAEAAEIARDLRDQYVHPLCLAVLAHVRLLRGDGTAVALAEQAAAAPGEPSMRAMTAPALARARLLAGDPDAALAALAEVSELEPDGFREPNELRTMGLRLEALTAAGRRDEAVAALAQVQAAAAGSSTRWTRSCAARFAGVLSKDAAVAEDAFAAAFAALSAEDGPVEHGLIWLDHGRWRRRAGQLPAARAVLRQAHAAFSGCGAMALAERAGQEIAATDRS